MTESRRMGAPMRTIDRTTRGTFVPRTVCIPDSSLRKLQNAGATVTQKSAAHNWWI